MQKDFEEGGNLMAGTALLPDSAPHSCAEYSAKKQTKYKTVLVVTSWFAFIRCCVPKLLSS